MFAKPKVAPREIILQLAMKTGDETSIMPQTSCLKRKAQHGFFKTDIFFFFFSVSAVYQEIAFEASEKQKTKKQNNPLLLLAQFFTNTCYCCHKG